MFKSARWKSEKNKIKVVFKLQFHATQVSGDALMISVVPADVGKPTLRLEKAIVRDGSCYWDKAVLETVKLIQEPKSGKFHEKIYYFILGNGSSKAGVFGEASIDFSRYAEATKIISVSLPLKNSKSGAVLHVSIQRIQDAADQSAVEEIEHAKRNSDHIEASLEVNSAEDGPVNKPVLHSGAVDGNRRASSESDITMSSSGSSSGLDDTPRKIKMITNIIHQDHINSPSSPTRALVPRQPSVDVSTTVYEENQTVQWELFGDSAHSTGGSSSTPQEPLLRLPSPEESDTDVTKLKSELKAVARKAEVADLELHTLRKQIVKECKRANDLSKEVTGLKKERDALKEECNKLKASQRRLDEAKSKDKLLYERGDLQTLVCELRQELNYQKDLNANLQIQLHKTQESNSELILAVRDLDEMLEQKNREIGSSSYRSTIPSEAEKFPDAISKHEMTDEDDEEQNVLEQLVREHSDVNDTGVLEQKIVDLHSEIEIYRRERDDLEMQMEQLALDNEILKQENHDMLYKLEKNELHEQLKMQYECTPSYATVNELEARIMSLEDELKKQSKEFSDSLVTISELKAQVSSLEEELEKQAEGFEDDLDALTRDKVEQEQRAIQAEGALRKTRLQNASTAERLQGDLKTLTMQMACSFETNEKLATKALNEANELSQQKMHLKEMLQKSSEDLQSTRSHYEAKILELSSQIDNMFCQMEILQSEIEEKSMRLVKQEDLANETEQHLLQKITVLEAEIENLLEDKKLLSQLDEQKNNLMAELEKARKSTDDMQLIIEQGHSKRIELETKLALVEMGTMETLNELESRLALMENEAMKTVKELETRLAVVDNKATETVKQLETTVALVENEAGQILKELETRLAVVENEALKTVKELETRHELVENEAIEMVKELKTRLDLVENETMETVKQLETTLALVENEVAETLKELESRHALVEKEASENVKELESRLAFVENEAAETLKALETRLALGEQEAMETLKELNSTRSLKDEKEALIVKLLAEVNNLKSECNEMKNSLFKGELEKETLRTQVFQLKDDLKEKEEELNSLDKKLKDATGSVLTSMNNKSVPISHGSSEVTNLKERIKLLEGQIKLKENTLDSSMNTFMEKEKDLQGKIEELERRLEELQQNTERLFEQRSQQKEATEDLSLATTTSTEDENQMLSTERRSGNSCSLAKEMENTSSNATRNLEGLSKEMELMRERNKLMEVELKEMQARYSDLSLKFAEVEGERQKLMMKLRNIKSAKKSS